MTTPDNTATTWRDLTDQLTTEQVAWCQRHERDALGDPVAVAEGLLDIAREHAQNNLRDGIEFGHLPAPAGAVKLWHWEQDGAGHWSRTFDGTCRQVAGLDVSITGTQHPDGPVNRYASLYLDERSPNQLDADQLRAIAEVLTESADELDALAAADAQAAK